MSEKSFTTVNNQELLELRRRVAALQQENERLRQAQTSPFSFTNLAEKPALPSPETSLPVPGGQVLASVRLLLAILKGPEHVFEMVNPQMASMLGSKTVLPGQPFSQVFPPCSGGQPFINLLDEVYRSGQPVVWNETTGLPGTGGEDGPRPNFYNFLFQPLSAPSGQVEGVAVMGVEVTEQVYAGQLGTELAAIIESHPEVLLVRDRVGIKQASRQALEVLGFKDACELPLTPEQLAEEIHLRSLDTGQPVTREALPFKRAFNGQAHTGEYLMYNPRLQKDLILRLGEAPVKQGDHVTGAILTGIDINEQIQVPEVLQTSQEFMRTILESSPDCIKVLDLAGNILYINESASELLEIDDVSQCLHINWLQFWEGPEQTKVNIALERARAGGAGSFEGMALTGRGNEKWWDVRVTPIRGANGQINGILSVSRDITSSKIIQKELKTALQELERVNTLKDQFLSVISHDLRSPLTSIYGYTNLLKRNLLEELAANESSTPVPPVPACENTARNLRHLEVILHQSRRMQELIGLLLDSSIIQSGQLELHLTEGVDLVELVRQMVENHGLAAQTHFIQLQTEQKHLPFRLDVARMEQVLDNIISNAVKYSPAESTITVGLEKFGEGGALVWVRDQGVGINPEVQSELFQQFYREHNKETENIRGLGLGLFISQGIIKQHRGQIRVESAPGQGSTFFIELPA